MTDMTLEPPIEPTTDAIDAEPVVASDREPVAAPARRSRRAAAGVLAARFGGRMRLMFAGLSAIAVKELRSRMRGRRAFVNVTMFLLIIGAYAWMVEILNERNLSADFAPGRSADIGRAIFAALMLLETFLVVILAPAFTAGSITVEREKQTIDLLMATPISSTAVVLGKLLSSLVFILVLVAASIPFTAVVFVFGGVAPDDVLRGYAVLLVTAIGFSSLGIFFSALIRRTQTATVVTYLAVLTITFGAFFVFQFWNGVTDIGTQRFGPLSGRAPAVLIYPDPIFAQADVLCGTESGFGGSCDLVAFVLTGSTFGGGFTDPGKGGPIEPGFGFGGAPNVGGVIVDDGGPVDQPGIELGGVDVAPDPFAGTRDRLWPRTAATWLVLSVGLVLAAIQLVTPTRRWRPRLPGFPGRLARRSP